MNTKDVRVDNIVEVMIYDKDNNEIWVPATILAIDGTGGNLMEYEFWFDISESSEGVCFDNRPMELTEEILLRCGFERVKPRSGIAKAYKNKSIRINMSNTGNFYFKRKPMDYLHMLQNLFYTNEQEELTLG